MQAIIFNHDKSKIAYSGESLALRICYLVCGEVCSAGTSHIAINIESNYAVNTFENKIRIIKHTFNNNGLKERLKSVNEAEDLFKFLKHKKNKSQAEIIMAKRTEKFLTAVYEEVKKSVLKNFQNAGLAQLGALWVKDGDFFCHPIDFNTQEGDSPNHNSASKLLQHINDGEDCQPEIFCLTFEFLNQAYLQKQQIIFTEPVNATADDAVYLKPCLTFPNVNALSATELVTVRSQLSAHTLDWRNQTNEWMAMIKRGEKNTGKHFETILMPCINTLQKKIDENIILKNVARAHDKLKLQLWMGEMPLHFIWNFYREQDALLDLAWNKLQEAKEKNPALEKREAVMVVYIPENKDDDALYQQNETVVASKKYISVD